MLDVKEFGIIPDTGKDMCREFNTLFHYCKENGIKLVTLEKGVYDFKEAHRICLDMPDSVSPSNVGKPRKFALALSEMNDFVLDCGGSEFVIHGEMTGFLINSCVNTAVENLTLIYESCPFSFLTVIEKEKKRMVAACSTPYELQKKNVLLTGGGMKYNLNRDKAFRFPVTGGGKTEIFKKNPFAKMRKASSFGSGYIGFSFRKKFPAPAGSKIAAVCAEKLNYGFVIGNSVETSLSDIEIPAVSGVAVFAYGSVGVTLGKLKIIGADGGFACPNDALGFIFCAGKISVRDCVFEGVGGNAISVRNEYFEIDGIKGGVIEALNANPYTSGFTAGDNGEPYEIYDRKNQVKLTQTAISKVTADKTRTIKFDARGAVKASEGDGLLNSCFRPHAEINGNTFTRIAKNGVFGSCAKEFGISGNIFTEIGESCIRFGGDEYCGGRIELAKIKNNTFNECGKDISVLPNGGKNGETVFCKRLELSGNTSKQKNEKKRAVFVRVGEISAE